MLKTILPQCHRGLWVGRDAYCGPDDLYMIWHSAEGYAKALQLIGTIGVERDELLSLRQHCPRNHSVGAFFGDWLVSISGNVNQGDLSLLPKWRRTAT